MEGKKSSKTFSRYTRTTRQQIHRRAPGQYFNPQKIAVFVIITSSMMKMETIAAAIAWPESQLHSQTVGLVQNVGLSKNGNKMETFMLRKERHALLDQSPN